MRRTLTESLISIYSMPAEWAHNYTFGIMHQALDLNAKAQSALNFRRLEGDCWKILRCREQAEQQSNTLTRLRASIYSTFLFFKSDSTPVFKARSPVYPETEKLG